MGDSISRGLKSWLDKFSSLNNQHDTPSHSDRIAENMRGKQFRLESLEPRLLLSGDPVLSELARWVEDDGPGNDAQQIAVIIQEINQAAESELFSGLGKDAPNRADLTVAWPEEYMLFEFLIDILWKFLALPLNNTPCEFSNTNCKDMLLKH